MSEFERSLRRTSGGADTAGIDGSVSSHQQSVVDAEASSNATKHGDHSREPVSSENLEKNEGFDDRSGENPKKGEVSDDQKACKACEKDWNSVRPKGYSVGCSFCGKFYCLACADVKKSTELPGVSRADVFWACKLCKEIVEPMLIYLIKGKPDQNQIIASIEHKIDTISTQIDTTIRSVVPDIIKKCMTPMQKKVTESVDKAAEETVKKVTESVKAAVAPAVEAAIIPVAEKHFTTVKQSVVDSVGDIVRDNVSKSWAEALRGDNFPDINDPTAQNAPIKPKVTFNTALKRAFADHRQDESRRKNVIIYRAPEPNETIKENREKADKELVEELLDHIEVPYNPVEILRLGTYTEGSDQIRPIKVVFANNIAQSEVMSNTSKLRNAPDSINSLSVQYDMNREERDQCREQVNIAKKRTKNSTTHYYRVVGRPGNMSVKDYPRKK